MAVCWPDVVAYLNTTLPGLWPTVAVFDGDADTGDSPLDYVKVGHVTDDTSGGFTQTEGLIDPPSREEVGSVRSELVCQTGDDNALPAVRARAFGYVALLDSALRADQTLGGALSKNATVALSADVLGIKARGTAVALVLTLSYTSISWGF